MLCYLMNMNIIDELTVAENQYQSNIINLIASENYPSQKVKLLAGSNWNNKYGEGYPGKRYYAGNVNTDALESFVMNKALEVFDATDNYGVNVQSLSGSPANSTVYLATLNYGDTILSLNLSNGGHLSHLHSTSNWNKYFKHITYDIKEKSSNNFEIDIDNYCSQIITHKPRLVIIGFSSYPRAYDFAPMIKFAHEHGCMVLADIAHISGLVATGLHSSPFKGSNMEQADFVTTTTHKTFRGPRGALIFAKNTIPNYLQGIEGKSMIDIINKTIFPGTSGGPHFATIAGIGQACLEILGEDNHDNGDNYKEYTKQILLNTKALEKGLSEGGLTIISPSQNHMTLVKLPAQLDSLAIQQLLESEGIICNRNMIPNDTKTAFRPSGLRLGTPYMTTRGYKEKGFYDLGLRIAKIILG
jgi:glycine hydroxymethyltransferase